MDTYGLDPDLIAIPLTAAVILFAAVASLKADNRRRYWNPVRSLTMPESSPAADDRTSGVPHFPAEAMHRSPRNIEELRSLTMKERGDLLIAACRAAAKIVASRKRSGLPPPQPAPWPESTVEFFKRAAADVRRK